MKRFLIAALLLIVILVAAFAYFEIADRNYQYHGAVIEPRSQAPDFSLVDQHSQPFRLSEQRGRVVMLYFGYTHCPDVCIATLWDFYRIREELGEAYTEDVEYVFISLDPERDTAEVVAQYLGNEYWNTFTGITGLVQDLEPVWEDYGVYREKVYSGSAAGYLMDHSARVYVVDRNGDLFLTFPFGMQVEDMTEDVRHILKKTE